MSSSPKSRDPRKKKLPVRTHTPRLDDLTREAFEFIAAVDRYKRRHMRSFLDDTEVLRIVSELGYRRGDEPTAEPTAEQLGDLADARQRYRTEHGRLFPTWSEVFKLLMDLGYRREPSDEAA